MSSETSVKQAIRLDMEDAMRATALIMDDEMEKAEADLSKGSSAYHMLGLGLLSFLQAQLGGDRQALKLALTRLDDAERLASDSYKFLQKDATAFTTTLYPAGMEFQLCMAQTQTMSAVAGILSENVTEAIKGILKVRRAVGIIQKIAETEKTIFTQPPDMNSSHRSVSIPDSVQLADAEKTTMLTGNSRHSNDDDEGEDEEDVYVDAFEFISDIQDDLTRDLTVSDRFVYSGFRLHRGAQLLLISQQPPSLSRLLSIVGFHGDRDKGLSLLWECIDSGFPDNNPNHESSAMMRGSEIHAVAAGLAMISHYTVEAIRIDIVPADVYPAARYASMLEKMRTRFASSRLWRLEEARFAAASRDPARAVAILDAIKPDPGLNQLEPARWYELGTSLMYMHDYEKSAAAFLKFSELSNWSPAAMQYIAGMMYIQMYRDTISSTDHAEVQAEQYAKQAEHLLAQALLKISKKGLFSKASILDTFAQRKTKKWTERAQKLGVRLADAVGISPVEELIFIHGGYNRMNKQQLRKSLEVLAFNDNGTNDLGNKLATPDWQDIPPPTFPNRHPPTEDEFDELAGLSVLRANIYRQSANTQASRALLEPIISTHAWNAYKKRKLGDTWPAPAARHEMAVCSWIDSGLHREFPRQVDPATQRLRLSEGSRWIQEVVGWESFELDSRVCFRAFVARQTFTQMLSRLDES